MQRDFSATKDGLNYLLERSALVDSLVRRLWTGITSPWGLETSQVALAAAGDLGRQTLFPYSEVDLIFLAGNAETAEKLRDAIPQISQGMNEVGLKCNMTSGVAPEFFQFDPDRVDASLALLDLRFLEGDQELFSGVRNRLVPEVMVPESQALVERLAELTRTGHRKFANTVFHLEPNVKEGPGGFQDYVTARWLAAISAMDTHGIWPDPHSRFSPAIQSAMDSAFAFLASTRSFLQFRNKRDLNILTWDAQDDAAAQKVGTPDTSARSAADWMRIYFGHARDVDHITGQLLEEMPAAQSLFYRQLETWRTGFSDDDFSVADGLVFFQKPQNLSDPDLFFALSG